jgi:hypothetical protein
MPSMADITVKKNDGTTNIVYTAVVASGGDKSPAVWRSNTVGTAAAHHPELRMESRANGTGTARRVDLHFSYPSLLTGTDGRITIGDRGVFDCSLVVPQGMVDADLNEYVSQGLNLLASTLVNSSVKAGFAPV